MSKYQIKTRRLHRKRKQTWQEIKNIRHDNATACERYFRIAKDVDVDNQRLRSVVMHWRVATFLMFAAVVALLWVM